MAVKDREWLEAMLEDWKRNRKLYDALASEYLCLKYESIKTRIEIFHPVHL